MNGNKVGGKKSLMSRKDKFNKIFNAEHEKELDPELEDLFMDDNDKDNYLSYESNKREKIILDNEIVEKKLQKYMPKQVSFQDWKNRENQHDIEDQEINSNSENLEHDNENNQGDDKVLMNQTINIMEKEDEQYLQKILRIKPDEIKKGKSVADQKKVYDSLIGLRIYIQNIMKDINKFPQSEDLIESISKDDNLSSLYDMTNASCRALLTNILKFNQDLNEKGSFKNILSSEANRIDVISNMEETLKKVRESEDPADENVFKELDTNFDHLLSVSEKVVNIWYRKTQVYSNKSNNKLLKILNVNDFCDHIKKSIDDNYDTIRLKTKRKREKFRVIGKPVKSLIEEEDENIYDDSDFYEFLLKEFFNSQEIDDSQNTNNRYDLTIQYLLNRKNKIKSNKKIDQKASKNRKLRFDVHEKIVNFMTPEPNLNEMGRDEIIGSLFGGRKMRNREKIDEEPIDVAII
jgi:protein AATF/BFR2